MAEINLSLSDADVDRIAARLAERLAPSLLAPSLPANQAAGIPQLYSEPEAAARFGVDFHTLRDARKRGQIEYYRVGRFVRYSADQLHAYLRRKK